MLDMESFWPKDLTIVDEQGLKDLMELCGNSVRANLACHPDNDTYIAQNEVLNRIIKGVKENGKFDLLELFKMIVPSPLVTDYKTRAKIIATEAHEGQFRKYDRQPYIVHPERVAARVEKVFPNSHCLIAAALLHDVFEDCAPKYKNVIAESFETKVFCLVNELTNPSKGLKAKREVRKAIDRQHIASVSFEAKCIKLIDRTDNLLDMKLAEKDFKEMYLEESKLLFRAIVDSIIALNYEGSRILHELAKEYNDAFKELKDTL